MTRTRDSEKHSRGFAGGASYLPTHRRLSILSHAVQDCRGCDLYHRATQAVFGEGPKSARIVMIGEQPGNEEDVRGRPFVGPAGRILDKALADSSIDRRAVYLTNAVKHFKFESRGKRRIHQKPTAAEVRACRPWLEAEINLIKPAVLVCLGATAAQALMGASFRVSRERGVPREHPWAKHLLATVHPSAILRVPDASDRRLEYERFVADLKEVRRLV